MTAPYPIALAPYASIADSQMRLIRPATSYSSCPPGLFGFRLPTHRPTPADIQRARAFLAILARPGVACPPEAVMLFRDAYVLDGKHILSRECVGVAESFGDTVDPTEHRKRQFDQLRDIADHKYVTLAEAGPPVVAIAQGASYNFGHMLVEILPRLVHVADLGMRIMRLLLPTDSEPLRDMVATALRALGLQAEYVFCPGGSILRVPALHWVTPVAKHEHRKSPTLLRLVERLVATAPATDGAKRLYIARPRAARRKLVNATEVEEAATRAGFQVVEPSSLPFASQVALFAGANTVVGPMGAGLTLAAIMPQGGQVAMFEGGNCDFFFWDLACLAGHRFDWAFTAPVTAFDSQMLERDMTIDPALARQVLAALTG